MGKRNKVQGRKREENNRALEVASLGTSWTKKHNDDGFEDEYIFVFKDELCAASGSGAGCEFMRNLTYVGILKKTAIENLNKLFRLNNYIALIRISAETLVG